MRRIFTAAGAAAALYAFGSTAQAVPIHFDFTGTTSSSSYSGAPLPSDQSPDVDGYAFGEAISGGFNLDSDRLLDAGTFGAQHVFVDFQTPNFTGPLASLSFGGRNAAVLPEPNGTYYTDTSFVGGCTPSGCPPNAGENFNIFAFSSDEPNTGGVTGTFHNTSLFFISAAFTRLPDYPFFQNFDYFDESTMDPLSILSLPLYDMTGVYQEDTKVCTEGECTVFSRQFQFSIDSVSRGVNASTTVPEPGPLGLLGAAILGCLFVRRRPARGSAT